MSAYAASKFAVEGWMEGFGPEVAPFGIKTMLVEPGFFRTELLTPQSTKYARGIHPGLRRPHQRHRRSLEEHGRQAGRRPGQTGPR